MAIHTPDFITNLPPNEVFVFGSNYRGRHGKGAAVFAVEKFGALEGVGEGLAGQSYGIPTKDQHMQILSLERIKLHVEKFLKFAAENPNLTFWVTPIGCGLSRYVPADIAPMFLGYGANVRLPGSFHDVLDTLKKEYQ